MQIIALASQTTWYMSRQDYCRDVSPASQTNKSQWVEWKIKKNSIEWRHWGETPGRGIQVSEWPYGQKLIHNESSFCTGMKSPIDHNIKMTLIRKCNKEYLGFRPYSDYYHWYKNLYDIRINTYDLNARFHENFKSTFSRLHCCSDKMSILSRFKFCYEKYATTIFLLFIAHKMVWTESRLLYIILDQIFFEYGIT